MAAPTPPPTPTNQPADPDPNDPLALRELFAGGGEVWLPLLKPIIETTPALVGLISPTRPKSIVPVRELTFQALKPNPPQRWKVVIFGQNPYPRVESATGIAMFDNSFTQWKDSRFGRVTSMRCIIKAACICKHGIDKKTPIAEVRALLDRERTVQPPEWFSAMLTQGVLLLNAALTASSDASLGPEYHTAAWRGVMQRIIEEILAAKARADDPALRGVVFGWWGTHAHELHSLVERLKSKYPAVGVRHVDHCNPAAQGDIFCNGNHFADINAQLSELGMRPVDWLPAEGWQHTLAASVGGSVGGDVDGASTDGGTGTGSGSTQPTDDTASRMSAFITTTMELHKFYLERLQEVKEEVQAELPAITGIGELPLVTFAEALEPILRLLPGLEWSVKHAQRFGKQKATDQLGEHEVAAVHLYTMGSNFYRELNAALRAANRSLVKPYFAYLRLFFSALGKLAPHKQPLWRGVALNLKSKYPQGGTVTWWGVSSCTSKLEVARGFLGSQGPRTLFEVQPISAVGIECLSVFSGEQEYVLAPGTRLHVASSKSDRSGLATVTLVELAEQRLVT